ncbi:MAG: domain S-box protein [Proteobacteria bacterium]|nr:domain S-box protein [Pseudomonadota bacterium]
MNPLAEHLLNACAETVIAVDPCSLAIVAANRQAESLLGYSVQDLIGRPIADIEVGLQDLFFWDEVKNGNLDEYQSVEGEYRHQSGSLIVVQKTVRLLNIDGSRLYVLSVHDTTAAKQLEDETARTTSLLAATLESTVDGILVTNLAGGIQHFNHRFTELWQLSASQFGTGEEPRALNLLLDKLADPANFREWFDHLLSQAQSEGSTECRLLDGRVFGVASRPQRLRERPIGRVFSFHDITSLKATEAQLIAARDAAQAASRAKSEFLSHMSHELRTPLNAILGFGKVLEEELLGAQQAKAAHIGKAGQHLLDLINEVLDLASIEAGKLRLDMRSVDLVNTIRDCVALVTPLAEARNIALHVKPLLTDRFVVHADARRLKQMTINLLSNAIKYNHEGGRVEIAVTASGDTHWRLTVLDTGIGIADEDSAQLFESFNRIGSHAAEIEGAGIGLALTRKLALLMQGNVGMQSEIGIGSRFWIELPCARSSALEPVKPAVAELAKPNEPVTLLYIEDDTLSQKLLGAVLTRKRPQYKLLTASSGAAGMALARENKPDLILLDQHLPDGIGAEIFKTLRLQAETRAIPVIALSGNAEPSAIQDAIVAGYAGYLTKPLQIDAALAHIDSVLLESGLI